MENDFWQNSEIKTFYHIMYTYINYIIFYMHIYIISSIYYIFYMLFSML